MDFSICTLATASAEPCSPHGEVTWSIGIFNRRVLALSRATTRTVSVLNVWGFRMHARRFMGHQNFDGESSVFPRRAPDASAAIRESTT